MLHVGSIYLFFTHTGMWNEQENWEGNCKEKDAENNPF